MPSSMPIGADNLTQKDFTCERLPGTEFMTPLKDHKKSWLRDHIIHNEDTQIMYDMTPDMHPTNPSDYPVSMSKFTMRLAGPRKNLHFDSSVTTVAIVTCGGLCPGLNDVIRGITLTCLRAYRVPRVIGFRYGFWGLTAAGRDSAIDLTPENVNRIHRQGGTILGSSRGPQNEAEMVDTLLQMKVNILFTIGGDGTQRGAQKIANEARRRGLDIAVMGIPKTIDNDLSFSSRTFGYETAVEQAVVAIRAAHSEASSHQYGVGIVKVMGRHSGFIAANATISSSQVNLCLIPEVPVSKDTVLKLLAKHFERATHVVIVVAEGFGQNWVDVADAGTDASGNKKLIDIGVLLTKEIGLWMKKDPRFKLSTIKYIDPSYMIRACPPSASDAAFCIHLSILAVHEAMYGLTNSIVGCWHDNFVVVPINLVTSVRKVVDIRGKLWRAVREITVDFDDAAPTKKVRQARMERELARLEYRRKQVVEALSKL